jgi:hypothetical protein
MMGVNDFPPAPRVFRAMALPAGSALSCSARDMGAYLSMMLGDGALGGVRLLSRTGIEELISPAINIPGKPVDMGGTGEDDHYAMGWMRTAIEGYNLVHHGGNVGSMSSMTMFDPDGGYGVSILFNYESGLDVFRYENPVRLCYNVLRLAGGKGLSAFGVPRIKDPNLAEPFIRLPNSAMGRLAGGYDTGDGLALEISLSEGGLVAQADMAMSRTLYKIDFINENRMVLSNKWGTIAAAAAYKDSGDISSISFMGKKAFPVAVALRSGYAVSRPKGSPWAVALPIAMDISYSGGTLTAKDDKRSISISMEKGEPDRPERFLPTGAKILRAGGIFTEQRGALLFYEQTFSLADGSAAMVCATGRGESCLVITLKAKPDALTNSILELLEPLFESGPF